MEKNDFISKVNKAKEKIKRVYLNNDYDWMIGFSGGKDSSVLVQIIFESIMEIKDKNKYKNTLHIVSSDTLVENPIVLKQLVSSLSLMEQFAEENNLPVKVHKVEPDYKESFWVNLVGRGYPLPNQSFRWCTDRLKIKPMNKKMEELECGKEILTVLGVRMGESSSRDIKLKKNDIKESDFKNNTTNRNNKLIFAPIEEFSLFDVWKYLGDSNINFFKKNNTKLSILYEDSSVGTGECPSSLDDRLQKGCGSSRWGCWLCPVVTQDKSLEGFINSGQSWLKPLLDFREELISGRDVLENRYHGSLRISKEKETANLIKYRYLNLTEKDGVYFLPKKLGRDKMIFGRLSEDGDYLINEEDNSKKYRIISEEQYRNKVDNLEFNPYSENEIPVFDFVIKLKRNEDNGKLSIMGLGPYTINYRKYILKKIKKLSADMEKYDVTIIKEEEIKEIEKIIKLVEESISAYRNQVILQNTSSCINTAVN